MKRFLVALFSLCFSSLLFAIDFHVTVIDSEIEIPLEGVVLTISDKSAGPWETDFNGECTVSLEALPSAVILQAYLPGYAVKKVRLSEAETEITIILSIEEVMEGKELVVEKEAYQKADAESGISVALTKDQIQTTALIGIFPDVMTTIKTLPGVGYAGSFCQQPSIRGSYPYETACVLDGLYVLQPYHWSGSVSIFDPLMVDSVKLSHGIFSAQYGHAIAALLDVNSINPIGDSVKINASASSIQTDLFAQIPVTEKLGFMAGLRMTYMNTIPFIYDNLGLTNYVTFGHVKKISDYLIMPYMYDYYAKGFYTPFDSLSISANAFLGLEGLGAQYLRKLDEDEKTTLPYADTNLYTYYYDDSSIDTHAKWKNIFGFGSINLKWLPTDSFQFVGSGAYNIYSNKIDVQYDEEYKWDRDYFDYNWETEQDEILHLKSLDSNIVKYIDTYYIELFQGKAAANYQINDVHLISVGAEELFQSKASDYNFTIDFDSQHINWWDGEKEPPMNEPAYLQYHEDTANKGNDIINTAGYTFWEFGNDSTPLKGELGLRFEHYYLSRKIQENSVSTDPYFNPRFSIQWTPIRYANTIDKLTFSAGSGIFTKVVDNTMDLGNDYILNKDNFKPDRNVFALIGGQVDFLENLSFQIEAYYKYYLNRFYTVSTPIKDAEEDPMGNVPSTHAAFSNGKGHVAGFDCMLHKKAGRYFDGYLCYSFVFSRYKNPSGYIKDEVEFTEQNDPLGIWYFPYYHRYNTINAVINYRPNNRSTLTLSTSVASGAIKMLYNEEKDRNVYIDKSRTTPVYPLNFRYAYSNYASTSKVKWEVYVGIENALGMLNKSSVLGGIIYNEEIDLSNIANFDTGIPAVSVGFRLSY